MKERMVLNRFGWAALTIVFLPACSLFESQATRREKAYERYVHASRETKVRRQNAVLKQEAAIPSAPAQQRQDVQTGDNNGMPVQPAPDGMPVPQAPGTAPAPSP